MSAVNKKRIDQACKRLELLFPNPDPDKQRYVFETAHFSIFLYDSRPLEDKPGEWTKTPVAKFSFYELDKMWQVSWMPPQGRWQKFGRYYDIETCALVIKGDPTGCFTGVVSPLAYLMHNKTAEKDVG